MEEKELEEVVGRARIALANANPNWDESKHPRGPGGRFGNGVGAPSKDFKSWGADEWNRAYDDIAKRQVQLAERFPEMQTVFDMRKYPAEYRSGLQKINRDLDELNANLKANGWAVDEEGRIVRADAP